MTILVVLVGVLVAATVGAAIEYLRQLSRIKAEYMHAKGVVEDIVLSFNRQFHREARKSEMVAYKFEAVSSKGDRALKGLKDIEAKLSILKDQVDSTLERKVGLKVDEIVKKVSEAVESCKRLTVKVSDLERAQQSALSTEPKIEAVIPLRREKALAPLTKTELSVLEILALEGPKTASNIRDGINLSREHTTRLMKRLYDAGYLERDTSRIPFKYWIKAEMEELLEKSGAET